MSEPLTHTASEGTDWQAANQQALTVELGRIAHMLEGYLARIEGQSPPLHPPPTQHFAHERPPAFLLVAARFGLSPFERDLLLLAAGVELDGRLAALCAQINGEHTQAYATFSLALAALAEAHWSALAPESPLRRWRLLELGAGGSLTAAPLRISERVLHFLAGLAGLDEQLAARATALRPLALPPSHVALAEQAAGAWVQAGSARLPLLLLCGASPSERRAVAAAACLTLDLQAWAIEAARLPSGPEELALLVRIWERELALSKIALLVECASMPADDGGRIATLAWLVENLDGPLLLSAAEQIGPFDRALLRFELPRPTSAEQRALWRDALGPAAEPLGAQLERIAAQFSLSAPAIEGAARTALLGDGDDLAARIWAAGRGAARPVIDGLAQRTETNVGWDDLVLPDSQRQLLHDIAAHLRARTVVYEQWGFAAQGTRGMGISALFAGASGTGKTMAAEVLAHELQLDLYRIDLSAVVSKYIGETEKNLRRIFDEAEAGGAILLFDEADALFGKRSEVKDSHDRYANIEVSYLLQRIESYRGLAILTSNFRQSLDSAFLRRIRFAVQFPFPDAPQRAAIWRRAFPQATPTAGLVYEKLARLSVAGGNIRNIALGAALLAADEGQPVGMAFLLRAARAEYAKLERNLTDAEIGDWIGPDERAR